jgi:hypothetical protein
MRKPVSKNLASEPDLRQMIPVVVTGFITIGSEVVARMERSEIREQHRGFQGRSRVSLRSTRATNK